MPHTILVLSGGDLGLETMLIRTVLSQPSSPVEINWGQGEGWIPTQFQAAHAYGGLRQLAEMIAFEDCENSDDCVCDCDNADHLPIFERARLGLVSRDVADIAEVLIGHGERFAGDDVEGESQHWIDHDFDASEVADWCDIGCWNPATAAVWRDDGLTPAIVTTAAEALLASLPEECDPADVYTDGCPIYSCCNDDTDPEVVLQICRDVVREFDKLTLCEWADSKEHVMVYVMGTAYPAGTTAPYGNPDMDWLDRIGVDKLHGTVNEHGAWQWDGEGHPRDERGNSILNVTAYIDKKGWESAVAEYNAEV